jgi:hypothetical protein
MMMPVFRTTATEKIERLESELRVERKHNAELSLKVCSLDLTKGHLAQCEAALVERDAKCTELEKELDQKSLYFVGYTNGNQIAYAKEDEGSFYVNTDNDCYIPVYMLAVHLHRLGGTASEEWMTVLQTKQLGEGVEP